MDDGVNRHGTRTLRPHQPSRRSNIRWLFYKLAHNLMLPGIWSLCLMCFYWLALQVCMACWLSVSTHLFVKLQKKEKKRHGSLALDHYGLVLISCDRCQEHHSHAGQKVSMWWFALFRVCDAALDDWTGPQMQLGHWPHLAPWLLAALSLDTAGRGGDTGVTIQDWPVVTLDPVLGWSWTQRALTAGRTSCATGTCNGCDTTDEEEENEGCSIKKKSGRWRKIRRREEGKRMIRRRRKGGGERIEW